jgi:hypothetical protein
MPIGSTGLLIIRAYLETESPAPLRAEIRLTSDVSAGIERALTLVDVDRVAEVVRSWLLEDILKTPVGSSPVGQPPGGSGMKRVSFTSVRLQPARSGRGRSSGTPRPRRR